jgi:hypothetical protein
MNVLVTVAVRLELFTTLHAIRALSTTMLCLDLPTKIVNRAFHVNFRPGCKSFDSCLVSVSTIRIRFRLLYISRSRPIQRKTKINVCGLRKTLCHSGLCPLWYVGPSQYDAFVNSRTLYRHRHARPRFPPGTVAEKGIVSFAIAIDRINHAETVGTSPPLNQRPLRSLHHCRWQGIPPLLSTYRQQKAR